MKKHKFQVKWTAKEDVICFGNVWKIEIHEKQRNDDEWIGANGLQIDFEWNSLW